MLPVRLLAATGCLTAILGLSSAVQAQEERQVGKIVDDAQQGAQSQLDLTSLGKSGLGKSGNAPLDPEKPDHFKPDLLIVPIPQASPSLGLGITLAAVLFYNPNGAPSPWVTGFGAMYTKNKSWGAGAFHNMSLGNDRVRFLAFAGYADANVNFYGIGPQAGERDISVEMNDKGKLALLQAQYRIVPHLFIGGRYEFLDLNSKITLNKPLFPDLNLPQPELESRISSIGPAITYDTRDDQMNPGKGTYVTLNAMFNLKDLGSNFEYQKVTFAANGYLPVARGSTLALRASFCAVSKGGPFYDLCMYGINNDLRGYEPGRYRDRAFWALQAEWRQHLGGGFGGVVFAGVGGIAPSIGDLGDTKLLPAAGLGLRYKASQAANVNLHLDVAIGDDSSAVYFGIAEAF